MIYLWCYMTKKRELIYAVLLLMSGVILGSTIRPYVCHPHGPRGPFGPKHQQNTEMIMRRLTDDLELTVDQQNNLRPIMDEMHSTLQQIRRENRPRLDAALNQATEKSKAVLTPEQVLKLNEIHNRLKNHFDR